MTWFARRAILVLAPLLVLASLLAGSARAVEPGERLSDPALEARARAISGVLRCLVCQNESIDESGADLAHNIRLLVRQRLTNGDTDAEVIQSVVNRYGDFVLLSPPVQPATYPLWFAPPALLVVGAGALLIWARRRPAVQPASAPLTEEERKRVDSLLQDDGL